MQVTRKHPFTGHNNTLDLPITMKQMNKYHSGVPVQKAFPNLNADQREFIISGLLPGEFDEFFEDDEWDVDNENGWGQHL